MLQVGQIWSRHVTQEEKSEQETYEAGEVCKPLKISLQRYLLLKRFLKWTHSLSVCAASEVCLFLSRCHVFIFCISVTYKFCLKIICYVFNSSTLTYGGLWRRRRIKSSVTEESWSCVFPGGSDTKEGWKVLKWPFKNNLVLMYNAMHIYRWINVDLILHSFNVDHSEHFQCIFQYLTSMLIQSNITLMLIIS